MRPFVATPWRRLVNDPVHHLNDFCLFRDAAGRWHTLGIMGTGSWDSEQSLFHAVGESLDRPLAPLAPILTDPPAPGLPPQKHAPDVAFDGERYHLFYRRPPGTICRVETADPLDWSGLGEELFTAHDARDVQLLRRGDGWWMVYCQWIRHEGADRSAILLRESDDLRRWGAPGVIHVDTERAATHSYLESPYLIEGPEGWYLFVRHRLYERPRTTVVLHSDTPDRFPCGTRQWIAELPEVHAPELVQVDGVWHIVRVSGPAHSGHGAPERGGWLEIAALHWR